MNADELGELKYRQLQKLAKEHGIKANQPKATLVELLTEKMADKPISRKSLNSSTASSTTSSKMNDTASSQAQEDQVDNSAVSSPNQSLANISIREALSSRKAKNPNRKTFDKENFDMLAAEAERFVENVIANSPKTRRSRSSILTMPPSEDPTTASMTPITNTPLAKVASMNATLSRQGTPTAKVNSKPSTPKTTIQKSASPASSNRKSSGAAGKAATPLNATKTKKSVTLRASLVGTPGSVTKAKDKIKPSTSMTGIPRPRNNKMPDFAKMHEKNFKKMDTLGDYLSKKKERMAALTPGEKLKSAKPTMSVSTKKVVPPKMASLTSASNRKSPRSTNGKVVTNVKAANFKFGSTAASAKSDAKKPFTFTARSETPQKKLSNITNKKPATASEAVGGYRPYTGKVKPWNPKKKMMERQQMANKTLAKSRSTTTIKGVRLNKRTELMLQKRRLEQQQQQQKN